MPLIDYSFHGDGRILRLECQIADGWRRAKETYCFREEIRRVPWKADYTLAPKVGVFPRPISLADEARQFRVVGRHSGEEGSIKFVLEDAKLRLDTELLTKGMELNEHLPWHETHTKKPCIGWSRQVNSDGRLHVIDLLIVFDPPLSGPAPVYRDWFRRFYPGGLPSLGKRR